MHRGTPQGAHINLFLGARRQVRGSRTALPELSSCGAHLHEEMGSRLPGNLRKTGGPACRIIHVSSAGELLQVTEKRRRYGGASANCSSEPASAHALSLKSPGARADLLFPRWHQCEELSAATRCAPSDFIRSARCQLFAVHRRQPVLRRFPWQPRGETRGARFWHERGLRSAASNKTPARYRPYRSR